MLHPPDRGPIVLVPHDPAWAERFAVIQPRLEQALAAGSPRIEHIGSTAVPGLAAKPVIDILVGLAPLASADVYTPLLEPLGIEHAIWAGEPGRIVFIARDLSLHLHLVLRGSWMEQRHLHFRDALCADPSLMHAYEALKRNLAARHGSNREAYAEAKNDFIDAIVGPRDRSEGSSG